VLRGLLGLFECEQEAELVCRYSDAMHQKTRMVRGEYIDIED